MPAANLEFQDIQFKWQVPTGIWRWTTRIDTSGASPKYEVRDIISPYGLLRDSIPLPGDVVVQMGASIVKVQQAFAPRMLLNATSLTFTLDEGRGFSLPQTVLLTNNGAFGSLLSSTITSTAAYVKSTPANVSGLASGATGSFGVSADSSSLLAINSPYAATLTVQDANATNSPLTIDVSVVVRPKATISPLPNDLPFVVQGPYGGPWAPIPVQTFQILNSGPSPSVLDYQIQKLTGNSPWLTGISPLYGSVPGSGGVTITVTVTPTVNMIPGFYEETLRVSGYSSNSYADVLVSLTVI